MLKFLSIIVLIFSGNISFVEAQKPAWVEKILVDAEYYTGIGVSAKTASKEEYIKKTKDAALNDLASQIKIDISSEFIQSLSAKSGVVKENIASHLRTTTQEELEGYELVDTWENAKEYWVYYRLSKSHYQTQKEVKLKKAVSLSSDFFMKAKTAEKEMMPEKSLSLFLQALVPIEKYINEPLQIEYENSKIFLMNELYISIQHLLSEIKLEPNDNRYEASIGRPPVKQVEINASFIDGKGTQAPVTNLPLRITFLDGSGDYSSETVTDSNGVGKCQISRITAKKSNQTIRAEVDINRLINLNKESIIIRDILNSFMVPEAIITLHVAGLRIYIESNESLSGKNMEMFFIEPLIKKRLAEESYTFTDDLSKASVIIRVSAESRNGTRITALNVVTSFVDVTVSVSYTEGKELYKNMLSSIKGVGPDFNSAGLKAYEKAAATINDEIIPELIRIIQQ